MSKLTTKQQDFIKWYCLLNNATQAAIKAGYSKRTARSIGQENLTKPYIQKAVRKEKSKLAQELDVQKELLVYELDRIKDSGLRVFEEGKTDRIRGLYIAVSAIGKMSKLLGYDKPELYPEENPLKDLTKEELQAIIDGEDEEYK